MISKTLAWWDSDNFGDALNPYIFRSFGINVSYQQSNTADFLALGSLMERIFKGGHAKNETFFSPKPIDVWGSGVHFRSGEHIEQPDIELPEKFIRDVNFCAVRGKTTKKRIENILGKEFPEDFPLGDPGLLLNRMIKEKKRKKYELGIVCHFHDVTSDFFKNTNKKIKNSIIIDVNSDPVHFINQLTQCKALISSAMHPLIVADSYGIPNLWISTDCNEISSYKYEDYYSVFNISKPPVFKVNDKEFDESDLIALKESYSITKEQVKNIQDKLISSFPSHSGIKNEMKFLNARDYLYLNWRVVNRNNPNTHFLRKLPSLLKKCIVTGW